MRPAETPLIRPPFFLALLLACLAAVALHDGPPDPSGPVIVGESPPCPLPCCRHDAGFGTDRPSRGR